MSVTLVTQPELTRIANELIVATSDFLAVSVIGGDRVACCDEGLVAKNWGRVVGLATIAPNGESQAGDPTIVGVYVRHKYRKHGVGQKLLEASIRRCIERGFKKIHVDTLTRGGKKLVEKLQPELRDHLEIWDLSHLSLF